MTLILFLFSRNNGKLDTDTSRNSFTKLIIKLTLDSYINTLEHLLIHKEIDQKLNTLRKQDREYGNRRSVPPRNRSKRSGLPALSVNVQKTPGPYKPYKLINSRFGNTSKKIQQKNPRKHMSPMPSLREIIKLKESSTRQTINLKS